MNMREDLKAFIDNEVSDQERIRILQELENNPELQAEVIELRQMSRVIKEEAWQPEPVGLERTLAALAGAKKQAPWWMGKSFQLAIGASCLVVFAAILFPVFAQSKISAKSDMAAMNKVAASPSEMDPNVDAGWSGGADLKQKLRGLGAESERAPQAPVGASGGVLPKRPSTFSYDTSVNGTPNLSEDYPNVNLGSVPGRPRFEIKTASLAVEVEDVPKAQQEAESIAKAVNGRVQSSQKSDDEGRLASAELTFRVPVASFETAVNRLRKLGRVLSDSLSGEDVTAQVADTEARLKVMKAEEDQYVELLRATKKIGEVLSVKERLSDVRQEIESLEATRKALRAQAAESTIHLSLTEKPTPDRPRQDPNWSDDAWSRAVSGLNSVGRALGRAAVYLFVFSPIWIPPVLVVWWLARRRRG